MIADKLIAFLCAFLGCVAVQGTASYGYTPAAMPTNAALQGAATITYPGGVTRDTFGNNNGASPLFYMPGNAPCPLNAGAGDNGSQVKSADGKCWLAVFDPAGFTAQQFGAVGDGTANDTVALQAASNAAAAGGVPLLFDAKHLYSITATITIASPVKWMGQYRYGPWVVSRPDNSQPQICPWGIVNKTGNGFNMVTATALTGTIDGVCFDATGNNATQAPAGAVLNFLPPSSTTYQAGWLIQNNTILNPYDGIAADGNGGSACCGQGAAITDPGVIANNTIVNPLDWAIALGRNTSNGDTSNITVYNNIIICGTHGQTVGNGLLIADGSITVDATQVGPVGCNIAFAIEPTRTIGGYGQAVNGNFKGQLGSFSHVNDILIKPSGAGSVVFANFESQVFTGGAFVSTPYTPILIDCTGVTSGGGCQEIAFTGLQVAGPGNAPIFFHVIGNAAGPSALSIVGSSLCQAQGPAANAVALQLDLNTTPVTGLGAPGHIVISGNRIGQGCEGQRAPNAIALNITGSPPSAPYGEVAIVGNDLSGAVNAITYTPTSTGVDHVVIQSNVGIDTEVGNITSAATITFLPSYNVFGLSGTVAVSNINGAWVNRVVTMVPTAAGIVFNTGGNICNSVTTTSMPITARWVVGFGCWILQ